MERGGQRGTEGGRGEGERVGGRRWKSERGREIGDGEGRGE